uniref:Uncharacterized protein ycf33 n=1 Tax=Helminthora furcellata TaxID=1884666 RepID=A0A1G4NRD5_9FLOR|nr:Hypothetical protein ycf33 [Helminthora furcellata]SCW21218.1 Hypothetical protein ycf33 [Helminthora furcellata]SCW24078.1 Hypothetical protein ycf33 [Helminthora furcellata]
MYNFWENIWKFPKFIISVFIGFFLTAAYPFFQLSKKKKISYFIPLILFLLIGFLSNILRLMLGYS